MRYLAFLIPIFAFLGCSNTWHGAKEDTHHAYEWSKGKVHDGAEWVGKKTE